MTLNASATKVMNTTSSSLIASKLLRVRETRALTSFGMPEDKPPNWIILALRTSRANLEDRNYKTRITKAAISINILTKLMEFSKIIGNLELPK